MPEVQNVGAADYAQYQPSEYQYQAAPEEMGQIPEVYDEETEAKKKASSNLLGYTIAGASAALLAGLLTHHFTGKSAKEAKNVAEKAAEEAKQKAEDAVKKYEDVVTEANKLKEEADNVTDSVFGGLISGRKFANKFKEFLAKFKKEETKVAEEAKNTVEEAGEGTAKKAEEAAENI